jgi:hypothetical protein
LNRLKPIINKILSKYLIFKKPEKFKPAWIDFIYDTCYLLKLTFVGLNKLSGLFIPHWP